MCRRAARVVTSAAISVPTIAVPTLVPTSCAVSLSAAPIEVRLLGHRVDQSDGADRHDGPQADGHDDHADRDGEVPVVDAPRHAGQRAGQAGRADQAGDAVAEALARATRTAGVAASIVTMIGRFARPARTGLQP